MKRFSAAPSEERDDEARRERSLDPAKTAAATGCRIVLLEDAWTDRPRPPPPIPVDYFEDPYC